MALSQSPAALAALPSPGYRIVPSTTPEREKLINRPINTTFVELGTRDAGDKWMLRTFKAQ